MDLLVYAVFDFGLTVVYWFNRLMVYWFVGDGFTDFLGRLDRFKFMLLGLGYLMF